MKQLPPTQRWAACIEYDGTAYHGWQTQSHATNIQDTVSAAFSKVANTPIHVDASGRTDAGVHAYGQIIHFDTHVQRSQRAWVMGANRYLPDDVAVLWARPVADDFHSRHSAIARTYQYLITDRLAPPALWLNRVFHSHYPVQVGPMHEAAQALLGERDFSSFRAAGCQSKSPFRNVHWLTVQRRDDGWIELKIKANAFLQHMVRNIAGSLWEVGIGKRQPQWIAEILAAKDRRVAGISAPPQGLYMLKVHYPEGVLLPENNS